MRENGASVNTYIVGFLLSLVLTFSSFGLVFMQTTTHSMFLPQVILVPVLLLLAVCQLVVQLIFFLHLASGRKTGWRIIIFLSTISLVLIILSGSLWIMNNLNYRMTPSQIMQYTNDQSGL